MNEVYICDSVRTPFGRYAGGLSSIRTDDLGAIPIKALIERNPSVDWDSIDDVVYGCANQSGEDNRNVARMSSLLAGLSPKVPGVTVNRLCGSGLNSIGDATRAIRCGEAQIVIAGGVESMSRAPYVIAKANSAFDRSSKLFDTTMGWRFENKLMKKLYGTDPMPQTAENLSKEFSISRNAQDKFALQSQQKAAIAQRAGLFTQEIVPVNVTQRRAESIIMEHDEHLRNTSLEKLSNLLPIFEQGTVTAGNASGINDGACALLLASTDAVQKNNLNPVAKITGMAVAGVPPRTMGIGPVPATQKLLKHLDLKMDDIDIIEINEAFAAQVLACMKSLNIDDDDQRLNPQGGAIALGHPLGASGARLVLTAAYQLQRNNITRALCTMCVGVGQGIAMVIEKT